MNEIKVSVSINLKRRYLSEPAIQSIKLYKETYLYMTSAENCPEWEKTKNWLCISKRKRLESHLKRIMEHLNGTSFTYQVFED